MYRKPERGALNRTYRRCSFACGIYLFYFQADVIIFVLHKNVVNLHKVELKSSGKIVNLVVPFFNTKLLESDLA